MGFIGWIFQNFGLLFGGVFLGYLFLMIHRLVILYDRLRLVPPGEEGILGPVGRRKPLDFLECLFQRLRRAAASKAGSADSIADAIWSEVDARVSVHFHALNGYVNTIILIGFAGTIFGSIGAFNEMFRGLAQGQATTAVFVSSWNSGLSTALYTSLGAAAIGGPVVTLLCSRVLMVRAKRLETLVGLRIAEVIEEAHAWRAEDEKAESRLREPKTLEKTSSPTCFC